jgi:SAM-dependent methyltransferase
MDATLGKDHGKPMTPASVRVPSYAARPARYSEPDRQGRLNLMERLAKWYLSISQTAPPSYHTTRVPLQRAAEEHQDELVGGFLKWFDDINLLGRSVLDLGSGYGGRTVRFKELGASSVVGVEIAPPMVKEGMAFARAKQVNVEFLECVGERLPFPDNSFDVITSYDVMEHVERVDLVLRECKRVLRPGGTFYAVFPPFYHPTGSHLDGFVSKMPYANLFFAPQTLMNGAMALLRERGDDYRPMALRPTDRLWTLNGVIIRSFERILKDIRFSQAKVEYAPLFSKMNSKWDSWRMKYYAFAFRPLRHVPLLRELFVHRIVCQLTK